MDKIKKMQELVDKLNNWNYHYYTLDNPVVTDAEYDKEYNRLLDMENELQQVLPDSPTLRVGGDILTEFKKHNHIAPLYSLDKCKSFEELKDWDNRIKRLLNKKEYQDLEYVVEMKFDGLTINVTYDDGYILVAATRGNGTIGEDITEQVLRINSLPLNIDFKERIEIQGEGIMPLSVFKKYNQSHDTPLKNARNAAAGALRNLDPEKVSERGIDCYFYNVGYIEDKNFLTDTEMKEFLIENRFKVNEVYYHAKNIDEAYEYVLEIEKQRNNIDFLIDGAVIKVNSYALREKLGFTNKFPRWAMAFKYEAEEVSTKLLKVHWNVGRTAKVTPSAILKPVDIGGVTVSRATLNNIDDINRKNLRLNSNVLLRRSNDVIPEIMGVLPTDEETYEIKMPKYCPSCGSELYRDGVHYFCPNTLSCDPQIIARLTHFASRDAMNIEGLSEKTITKLHDELGINSTDKIYKLTKDELLTLDGFKEKRSSNLINAINNSKDVSLANFIYALGILNVGERTAHDLAQFYKNIENFLNANKDELVNIPDIGDKTADLIIEFINDSKIRESLYNLFELGVKPRESEIVSNEDNIFSEKTIVITGSFDDFTRKDLKDIIENHGGKVSSSVSKNTDMVFVGDAPGSKYDRAKELGIKVLDKSEVLNIIKEV
ncbi:MAG: NAD-dependent DNA ligase LigA [Tissierellia bacterium]|nr:NAD-dependent DNA ligase LigA [Tissierellia bacterium]